MQERIFEAALGTSLPLARSSSFYAWRGVVFLLEIPIFWRVVLPCLSLLFLEFVPSLASRSHSRRVVFRYPAFGFFVSFSC